MAGHTDVNGLLLDSHAEDVHDDVAHALDRTAATAPIVERDNRTVDEETIVKELPTLRAAWSWRRGKG